MKLMLVGDPLQLPPCVLSNAGKRFNLSQSLYFRLYSIFGKLSSNPVTMLDTQYRMHPDICRFPSRNFYENRLNTDPSVARQMEQFSLKPLFMYDLTRSAHGTDNAGSSFNNEEALFIQRFCQHLISHLAYESTAESSDDDDCTSNSSSASTDDIEEESRTTPSDVDAEIPDGFHFRPIANDDPLSIEIQQRIAVITPYNAQIRLLRHVLPPYIEVMTADSSQGKEKDIVIISCVRSGGSIGFLDDSHRMNVMLTRSKNALYIVGNLSQLSLQDPNWKALMDHARAKRLIVNVDQNRPDLPYR
jgi:senataxin